MDYFVTTSLQSSDLKRSVRIIISYSSPHRHASFSMISDVLWIRLGRMVMSCARKPSATMETTCLPIVVAIYLYLRYFNTSSLKRFPRIHNFLVTSLLPLMCRLYMIRKPSLLILVNTLSHWVENNPLFMIPQRFAVPCCPSFRHLTSLMILVDALSTFHITSCLARLEQPAVQP